MNRAVHAVPRALVFLFATVVASASLFPSWARAADARQVVISEVSWMGTTNSSSDEWMELYNTTAAPISLNGWTLQSQDGTPSVSLSGTIPAHGHFLLERTDDTSVPGVAADEIYTGALGNGGETLVLTDSQGTVQDQTASAWAAGDNTTKATMQRAKLSGDGTLASSWATATTGYGSGLGYGTPQDAADTPPPMISEAFHYDLKFAGGLSGSTVTDPYGEPSSSDNLPMAQAMLARINAATKTIDFAVYGFRDQCAFEDALVAAQARGVVVRGVVDQNSDGSFTYHDNNGCDTQAVITALGKDSSGNPWVRVDKNPSTGEGFGYIMHNKFFVIDSDWVSTGSTNYSDTGIGGEYNANWTIIIQSANLASVYTTEFDEMWMDGLTHHLKSDNTVHLLPVYTDGTQVESYFSPTDDATNNAIIPAINGAQHTLDIAIFYLTSQPITDAILAAKNRGVTVRVILDSNGASNTYSTHDQLCAAGIPVKIENFKGRMHMKALLADNNSMIIGSQNFTGAANADNDENTLWIRNGAVGAMSYDYETYYNNLWGAIPDMFICKNPGSESKYVGNTCSDGIDNDFDGYIDGADFGCQ
ncbi:phospholipase D-like domain-containing protein [Oleiagrimonas sp. MCCC 1A03011]|uniref:phospholipase D-like domain-containing protein n=1 Tax=Oleiagrimonas sp. MCCC 1A03011 TaxID=1926883 RepID=UPI000DD54204|nr:phospholipase D-like domain-containing protein [Oleiagrimonas sp. MCCC 1A03011]